MISTEHRAINDSAFPVSARLNKASEFKRVFTKPIASSDDCFKVLAQPNEERRSRLGMAVSRKVDKRSVGRNRIKRTIRESFRRHFASSRELNLDIVVLPRYQCATICNEQLFRSLDKHWLRLEARVRKNTNG